MTEKHPIALPNEICAELLSSGKTFYKQLKEAAKWGADQELNACCEWVYGTFGSNTLHTARGPQAINIEGASTKIVTKN